MYHMLLMLSRSHNNIGIMYKLRMNCNNDQYTGIYW